MNLTSSARKAIAFCTLMVVLAPSAFGTLSANLLWEIRQAGSSNNGGAFRHNPFQVAPTIPTITGSGTGGTIAAGTYYCVITYTPGVNGETEISPQQSVVLSGATSSFTATHPSDPGNGTTWSLYVGTTTGGPYFPQGTALAIGSNRVVTTTPPTSGTQPPGVDRTLSTSANVAIDNAAITTSITTSVITFSGGYTPTGADVGNVVHMLTGTNVTAGWYEITGITSTTWTVDRNVVTSGTTTNATGNMGGAVDHPGTIGAIAQSGNTIFMKYSATAYTFSSGGSNTSGGTVTYSQTGISHVGYDTTRTYSNTDANRPICRPTANSLLLFNCNSQIKFLNLDLDNPATAKTGTTGMSSPQLVKNCRFNTYQQFAIQCAQGTQVVDCEFISCGSANATLYMPNAATAIRCIAKSCSTAGASAAVYLMNNSAGCVAIDCVAIDTVGGASAFFGGSYLVGCIARNGGTGVSAHGFNGSSFATIYEGCVSELNTGYGFANASSIRGTLAIRCFTRSNTQGAFKDGQWGSDQQIACGVLTGDPFTSAAGYDFSTNTTAGAGAALRGLTVTFPGGTTTSFPDAGAAQSSSSGSGGGGFRPRPRTSFNLLPESIPMPQRVLPATSSREWRKAG